VFFVGGCYWNLNERAQFMPLPLLCPIEYCCGPAVFLLS
jgi:hypothetical protein